MIAFFESPCTLHIFLFLCLESFARHVFIFNQDRAQLLVHDTLDEASRKKFVRTVEQGRFFSLLLALLLVFVSLIELVVNEALLALYVAEHVLAFWQ